MIDKPQEKKDNNNIIKVTYSNKTNTVSNTNATLQIDDFSCNQELQFKPVEKKSLIPEKKYPEKTTSKFDFAKPKKAEKRNQLKDLKEFESL